MVPNGIKVIDTTRWAFVPFCATCLADTGPDVIKVEDFDSGDGVRYVHASRDLPLNTSNPMIEYPNRGKRGLALRLDTEQGREILYELIKTADVFMTPQRPHS